MTKIIYFEIDIFAAIVLLIIMDYNRWKYLSMEQRLFPCFFGMLYVLWQVSNNVRSKSRDLYQTPCQGQESR